MKLLGICLDEIKKPDLSHSINQAHDSSGSDREKLIINHLKKCVRIVKIQLHASHVPHFVFVIEILEKRGVLHNLLCVFVCSKLALLWLYKNIWQKITNTQHHYAPKADRSMKTLLLVGHNRF